MPDEQGRCPRCQFRADGKPTKLCPEGTELLQRAVPLDGYDHLLEQFGALEDQDAYHQHVFGRSSGRLKPVDDH